MSQSSTEETRTRPPARDMDPVQATPRKRFKWGFASAAGVILVLLVAGQVIGSMLSVWPPTRAFITSIGGYSSYGRWSGNVLAAMGARDWVFAAFLVSATVFVILQRKTLIAFFRTMYVGVTLVILTTMAIAVGVLVPQIENFEDPEQRVTAANQAEEFSKFKWAEGYFAYHLVHLYGIGMPKAEIPSGALEGLERFGRIYGKEEGKNRQKMMEAAFAGQAKSQEIEDFIASHEGTLRKMFDAATFLDLNRTYKSNWFATLLTLLATAVLCNTFRYGVRRTFSVEKLGFFVTHCGILTLLAGGLISNLKTDRGILQLYLGEAPKDTYFRHYRSDSLARMPFGVRLDHFARKEWKAIDVHFLGEDFKSRVPRYTLWPGREIGLDFVQDGLKWKPQVLLRVRELYDHARIGVPTVTEGTADDGEGELPVVELEVPNTTPADSAHAHLPNDDAGSGPTRRLFMSPLMRNMAYSDPSGKFRFVAAYDADARSLFPAEGDDSIGTMDVEVAGSGADTPQPVRITLGQRVSLPRGYTMTFVSAVRDFTPKRDDKQKPGNPLPLAEQKDGFRAVWVDIQAPDGKPPERRLVIEVMDPIEYGLQQDYPNKDVVARLRWDRWTEAGSPRFVLGWGTKGEPSLTSQDGRVTRVAAGEPLPLPGGGAVKPLRFFRRARFEKNIQFEKSEIRADGWDASFYAQDERGLVLDVVRHPGQADESTETIKLATAESDQANTWYSRDKRFAIQFIENTEGFPFDWRSVLSIVKRDANGSPQVVDCGTEKQREIRVNDYFRFGGYRFFQTNASPAEPNYSGIGVVYDPGIPVVLAGMYTIIAGTFLAFSVRPIVAARKKRAAAAGDIGGSARQDQKAGA